MPVTGEGAAARPPARLLLSLDEAGCPLSAETAAPIGQFLILIYNLYTLISVLKLDSSECLFVAPLCLDLGLISALLGVRGVLVFWFCIVLHSSNLTLLLLVCFPYGSFCNMPLSQFFLTPGNCLDESLSLPLPPSWA